MNRRTVRKYDNVIYVDGDLQNICSNIRFVSGSGIVLTPSYSAANDALTITVAGTDLSSVIEEFNGQLAAPVVNDYIVLRPKARYGGSLSALYSKADTGAGTLDVKINNVAVTGWSGITADTTARDIGVGGPVPIVLVSSGDEVRISLATVTVAFTNLRISLKMLRSY